MRSLPQLVERPGSAALVQTLREAALKDDEGRALTRAIADLGQAAVPRAA